MQNCTDACPSCSRCPPAFISFLPARTVLLALNLEAGVAIERPLDAKRGSGIPWRAWPVRHRPNCRPNVPKSEHRSGVQVPEQLLDWPHCRNALNRPLQPRNGATLPLMAKTLVSLDSPVWGYHCGEASHCVSIVRPRWGIVLLRMPVLAPEGGNLQCSWWWAVHSRDFVLLYTPA
jgi:hypothetical protein